MTTPIRLLYLEDIPSDRRAFFRAVRDNGLPYEVTTVETLAAARARLKEGRFDLIVASYHLPDGYAAELFEEVEDLPILVLTGPLEKPLALETLERGAEDCLLKDPAGRYLEVLPFAVEKSLHRKGVHQTQRRLARELRRCDQHYRLLAEGMSDNAVISLDANGRIIGWNAGAERIFGWTKESIAGMSFDAIFTPEDRSAGIPQKELRQAVKTGRGADNRWMMRKDGTRFFATGSTACARDEQGHACSYVKVLSDTTRQKLAERVVRQAEPPAAAQGESPAGADKKGAGGRPAMAPRSKLSRYGIALGITAAALLALAVQVPAFAGRPPLVFLVLGITATAWWGGLGPGLISTVLATLVAWWAFVDLPYSFRITDPPEGARLLMLLFSGIVISLLSGATHRADERRRLALAQMTSEVAERRRAEAALREKAQLLDLSYDAVFAWPIDGTIRYWNLGAERLYGYTQEEALGQVSHEFLATRLDGGPEAFITALRRDRHWSGELRHRTRDGRDVIVESRMALVPGPEGDPGDTVIESNRDVTARKQVEESLRESEERFRTLANNISQLAWMADEKGGIFWYNQRWFDFTGTALEQMEGWGWQAVHHPEHVGRVVEKFRHCLQTGKVWEDTFPLRGKDGDYRWFLSRAIPIHDEQGKVLRWFGTNTDVTEQLRIQDELAAAKQSAERAKSAAERAKSVAEQANRAKDHFLAVLSHELRTPLTPVMMGVSMLQERRDLDAKSRETLEMIRRNVEMEARLIDDLLDVTRIARGKIELNRHPVELVTILQRAVDVCRPDIEARGVHFAMALGPGVPYWVDADVARLQQVFWNLLKNAVKFTSRGGRVGIRCRPEGKQVVVEVTDSGIGMEPEALERVFNAFEQAERSITRQFGGLGLGLAISKALVEMHGGAIDAQSEGRDRGATFRVRLPLTKPASREAVVEALATVTTVP